MNSYIKKLLLVCLALVELYGDATDNTIIPDRPGFSTGTYTVQPGRMNIEVGYDYSFNNNDNTSTQTIPLLVARTGITKDLEFDLMWDGVYGETRASSSETTVSANLTLGGKYRLYENPLYNFTFLGLVVIPTNLNDIFNEENIDYLAGLLWDYTYSDDIAFFGTIQTTSYQNAGKRVYDIQPAIGSSFTHTSKLSTYVELYAIMPFEASLSREAVLDGGVIYLINKDTQIDINLGLGLNKESSNFIGMGLALQF